MPPFDLQSIALATGVTLDVAVAGDPADPAIVLLHGFPESHRTWRHQITDLARDHFGIGPFTLAGHDWGGAVAWMAAIRIPGVPMTVSYP